jgi:MFS family permease
MFLIAVTGFSIGWGLRFLIPSINKVLANQLEASNVKLAMTLFFIVLGLTALPAGKIAVRIGNFKAMLSGIILTVFCLQLLALNNHHLIIVLILIAIIFSISLVVNGAVPFVLDLTPDNYSGLGVGMYFGGLTAASSLFEVFLSKFGEITLTVGSVGGAIALLIAFLSIALSMQMQNSRI